MVLWMLLTASTEVVCREREHCSSENELARPESASILLTKNTRKNIDPSDNEQQEPPELLDESDETDDTSESDTEATATTTTTTTTMCVRCQWRTTNDCDLHGSVKMDADAKDCTELIGPNSSESGFCDCNGNGELDDSFEQGFSCEDMAERSIVCGKHCMNVCKFQMYGDQSCSSAELEQYFSEANVSSMGNHTSWGSIEINNPGCVILLFEDAKSIEQLQDDISKLEAIPGTGQLVDEKRAQIVSLQDNPFQGTSFRYEGPGCHVLEGGEMADSAMTFEPCIDLLAPVPTSTSKSTATATNTSTTATVFDTSTTTTTCQKCLWQSTNNCDKNGSINKGMHRRTCDQQIGPCRDESGFCDCNGNHFFDTFEVGFNCGELAYEGVVCAKHCEKVCAFRLHSDAACLSKDYQKYYAEVSVRNTGDHPTWNSVSINQRDCNITLFEELIFTGGRFEYKGSGCHQVDGGKDARSLITEEPCEDPDKPYPTSTTTTTTCQKCAWRQTSDCIKTGHVYHGSFQRTCEEEIGKCKYSSGFCDCNGNFILDENEIGFNCGDLSDSTVTCAKHCLNVCMWELFDAPDCSANASATYYADTRQTIYPHEPWQSININLRGCNITLYEDIGFNGEGHRYNDGGCHPVMEGQNARSVITHMECHDPNATTTTTTTPCLKCMWRDTNECLANGTVKPNSKQRSCKEELGFCNDLSGFCDCNGNQKLDGNETGFDCGDLKENYIKCKDYCPNVCEFRFHADDNCTHAEPPEYYQDDEIAWVAEHNPWKSIWINALECQINIYAQHEYDGSKDSYVGAGCHKIQDVVFQDTGSFQTIQPCVKQSAPALVSLTAEVY